MESSRQISSSGYWFPAVTTVCLYGIGLAVCSGNLTQRIDRILEWFKKSLVAKTLVLGTAAISALDTARAIDQQRWSDVIPNFLETTLLFTGFWWQRLSK